MSSYSSWSVKGIDDRAREVAKEQARLKGVTLGDYINELLLQGHSEAGPRDPSANGGDRDPSVPVDPDAPSLDGLAQRIEAVEARSTLAITGIDQSVLGLLSRLESSERNTTDLAHNVEDMIGELRQTHAALIEKVEQLETTGDNKENLDALKALERALGKLASHVYEENTLVQEETAAIKGRIESGFDELTNRMNFVEDDVSQRLKSTAAKVDQAVRSAGSATSGDSEAVMRRLTEMQTLIDDRVTGVEEDVVSALNHVEGTLFEVQERLNTAETTTDTALKALEHTFAALNKRIDDVAQAADPEQAELLRQEFETRFESLASDLRASVEQTRETLAKEISDAAINADPQSFPALERQLTEMSGQVESQLEALAAREDQLLSTVSEKFNTLADQVDEQLAESEKRNAEAFEQVGEQVASAISRMQARHDETTARFSERLESFGERQDKKLSEALEGVSERLTDMQERTNNAVSPVQRAIATLAARLELVEEGNPDRTHLELPDMEPVDALMDMAPEADTAELTESDETVEPNNEPDFGFEPLSEQDAFEPETDFAPQTMAEPEQEADFSGDDFDAEPVFSEVGEELVDPPISDLSPAAPQADSEDDEAAMALSIAARVGAMAGGGNPFADPAEAEINPDEADNDDFVAGIPGLADDAASSEDAEFELDGVEEERLPTDDTDLASWGPEQSGEEDLVFADVEPQLESEDQEPVFEDAFEMPEEPAELAGEFDDIDDGTFADELDGVDMSDPENVFSDWDDGRDEARESDVFEDVQDSESDDEMAFEAFEDIDELNDDADAVSTYSEDAEDAASSAAAAEDEVLDEDEATSYLDRARNAAIRATNDKSTRFRAHQSGRGGVDRFSARGTDSRKRMPVLMAGAALMVTAAAAAGYFTLRDDLLASDTSFDIQTGPEVDTVAIETATASAALDEALAETESDAVEMEAVETGLAVEELVTNAESPVEPVLEPEPEPVIEAAAPALPQIEIPKAITIEQAADNGNAIAQYQMGERLIQSGDISQGVASIRSSAENGLAIAEHRLAKLHEEGLGVPRDLGEARVWTERAAEGGNAEAMYDLGVFYAEGEGGLQSYAAAAKWFRQAAEFGVVDGQYNLALLFENGLGISPSDEDALYWYGIASRSGDGSAPADVRRVSDLLEPGTVADVNARVAAWSASSPTGPENGDFGDQVWDVSQRAQLQAVQTGLNALGYEAGVPDGILGGGTRQAIRSFQADSGLTPDGLVSDATINALTARLSPGG